jgi:hypothetical protein
VFSPLLLPPDTNLLLVSPRFISSYTNEEGTSIGLSKSRCCFFFLSFSTAEHGSSEGEAVGGVQGRRPGLDHRSRYLPPLLHLSGPVRICCVWPKIPN